MSNLQPGNYLVTGATGGIGGAVVHRLVKAGVEVYASGRNRDKLDALCSATGAHPLPFDLTNDDEVRDAVSGIDWFGVVNCGGNGGEIANPQDTDMAVYDRVMAINARGTMLVTKYAVPGMIEAGRGGSIVNVSSQAALVALPGHVSYGASKAAVDNITRVSALELGPYGIRVNSVNPTVVMTAMSIRHWDRPETGGELIRKMPLGRYATEDEIAGPIVFLLSNDATMITGVSLAIDGGYTIQ